MSVQDKIQSQVDQNDIILYMKGTPELPMCGFSSYVSQLLNFLKVDYASVNVLDDMEIREGIKTFSNWPTIPQLYVKGEFVGGCDILKEMYEQGELKPFLSEKGVLAEA